jgi:hypothetical protein
MEPVFPNETRESRPIWTKEAQRDPNWLMWKAGLGQEM